MKKRILAVILMALIFVTGFILRYLYIDAPLWYDEACSWTTAIKSFPSGIMNNLLNDDLQHTPLYFFLLHFWIKIFSQSEISMRVLSLIFSVLAIVLFAQTPTIVSTNPQNKHLVFEEYSACPVYEERNTYHLSEEPCTFFYKMKSQIISNPYQIKYINIIKIRIK